MAFIARTKHDGWFAYGVRRVYSGGGGGDSGVKYDNLEGLYSEQAASARLLRSLAEKNLPDITDSYVDEVNSVLSEGYVESEANVAASDMATANAQERAATERELSNLGVNPNDARFAGSMRATETDNAARMAAGKNAARRDANNLQRAVAQDAVGTFTGQSNSAAQQASSASSGMANLYNQQNSQAMQQQQMQSQNTANAVGGTLMALSYFKDGGKVELHGGLRKKPVAKALEMHAGFLGGTGQVGSQQSFVNGFTPPAPPPSPQQAQPQGPSAEQTMLQGGLKARKLSDQFTTATAADRTDKMGRFVGKVSESGGNQISSHAAGMRMEGDQAEAAAKAYEKAAAETTDAAAKETYLDSAANIRQGAGLEGTATEGGAAIGEAAAGEAAGTAVGEAAAGEAAGAAATEAGGLASTAPGVSGAVGEAAAGLGAAGGEAAGAAVAGEAVGAAAAGEAAATAGATVAAETAATTGASVLASGAGAVAAAVPWIGAAIAVGSLLGAFADGGEVEAQDLRDGSEVEGPGSHTDDIVPALLSDEEHVMNAEAAALVSHDDLDTVNQIGLRLREKGVTPDQIRTGGLRVKIDSKVSK